MKEETGLQTAVTEAQVEETTAEVPELPELTGTEKQIAWAEEIRETFRTAIGKLEAKAEESVAELTGMTWTEADMPDRETRRDVRHAKQWIEDKKAILDSARLAVENIVASRTTAKWWIEEGREMLGLLGRWSDADFISKVLAVGSEYEVVPKGELIDRDAVRLEIVVADRGIHEGICVTYPRNSFWGTDMAIKMCDLILDAPDIMATADVAARVLDVLVLAGFKVYAPMAVTDKMTTVDRTSETEESEPEAEPVPDKTLIAPEEVTHSGEVVVRITTSGDTVIAEYKKSEDFREIVKAHGFYWNADNRVWVKDITRFTGSAEDRAAEIANALLKAGFTVRLKDEELRRKAVEADFEPEITRWVKCMCGGKHAGKLVLSWAQGDDDMYDRAGELRGAKYVKYRQFVIPVAEYASVLDLADAMGCGISDGAREAIDAYRASIMTVSVKDAKKADKVNKDFTDVLNSSRDVLDDLRDDD